MSPLSSSQAIMRFGDFAVDLCSGELRKGGTRIKLQVQPFQVLRFLLEHPGELVTREELQKRIWPVDTFVDFDQGLNNAVRKLRDALADDAEKPRFIETLSKRGYRFIGSVEEHGNEARTLPATAVALTVDSIAVLPFVNMSPDPENEFFVDGMTEEIINALSQIEQLRVVARTSSFFFKWKHIDMRQIGETLNVRTVVEGCVRKAGDRLRITAQLVNAADGYHLWSNRYDGDVKDVFAIQDEVARSIADRLKITLGRGRQEPLIKTGTTNLEAYQLYLKGRSLLYQRGVAIPRALECFKRAVGLDDEYALAWAGLADSYTVLGYYGLAQPAASMPKGTEAARHAVALDPTLAESHNALAVALLLDTGDSAAAEREFLCALELNPRYIQARDWYALFYLQLTAGRLEEGVDHARMALETDPLSGYTNAILGMTLCLCGSVTEALAISQRGAELDSESFVVRWVLHQSLYFSRRFDEAVAVGEAALAMSGRHPWAMATLSTTLADCGRPAEAQAIYLELLSRARRSYVQPGELAIAAAAAGMRDDAVAHARTAVSTRDPARLKFSKYWPWSTRLREDPRFREILLKAKLD